MPRWKNHLILLTGRPRDILPVAGFDDELEVPADGRNFVRRGKSRVDHEVSGHILTVEQSQLRRIGNSEPSPNDPLVIRQPVVSTDQCTNLRVVLLERLEITIPGRTIDVLIQAHELVVPNDRDLFERQPRDFRMVDRPPSDIHGLVKMTTIFASVPLCRLRIGESGIRVIRPLGHWGDTRRGVTNRVVGGLIRGYPPRVVEWRSRPPRPGEQARSLGGPGRYTDGVGAPTIRIRRAIARLTRIARTWLPRGPCISRPAWRRGGVARCGPGTGFRCGSRALVRVRGDAGGRTGTADSAYRRGVRGKRGGSRRGRRGAGIDSCRGDRVFAAGGCSWCARHG